MAATSNLALIDAFCDSMWLEHGLSKNSLDAYRRDLRGFVQWLEVKVPARAHLHAVQAGDISAYFAARHAESKPSTANRRLSVLRRFYQLALRQHQVAADPCLKLPSAKQPTRMVHTLTEVQVEALLDAPDVNTPLGLRERTMLELMYASGLRVSELVDLKIVELSLNDGVLRITGKGAKTRLVPFGAPARAWIERYVKDARGVILNGQQDDALFVTGRGGADDAPDVLDTRQETCGPCRHRRTVVAAHIAPRFCNPFAQPRRRSARGAIVAGTRRYLDDADLYARGARTPEKLARSPSPTCLIRIASNADRPSAS